MHELSIIQSVFTTLEEIADDHRLVTITRVRLKIGRLQQIVPDMLEFAFDAVAQGTTAEGASLEIEIVPIVMRCRGCGTEFQVDEQAYICPHCSGTALDTLQGMDIVLDSISGEQDDE